MVVSVNQIYTVAVSPYMTSHPHGNYVKATTPGILFCCLLAFKPTVDFFYNFESLKIIYLALLLITWLAAAWTGLIVQLTSGERAWQYTANLMTLIYFGSLAAKQYILGSNEFSVWTESTKIVSPFVLFWMASLVKIPPLVQAITLSALFNILTNLVTLALPIGWVYWGDILTFKGLYYYKTDLAYSVVFSLLIWFNYRKWDLRAFDYIILLISAAEIYLANSRINYLLFAVSLWYVCARKTKSLRISFLLISISSYLIFTFVIANNVDMLGFDTADPEAFTQGRNAVWEILWQDGITNFSLAETLFGRGFFADQRYIGTIISNAEAINAHSDLIHIIFNYGLVGIAVIFTSWAVIFLTVWRRIAATDFENRWLVLVAAGCYLLQGTSATLIELTTKTWPVVFLCVALVQGNEFIKSSPDQLIPSR